MLLQPGPPVLPSPPSLPLPARTPLSKHIFLPIFLPPNILPTVARANWHQEQGSVFPLASFSPSHLCILYVCCLCVSESLCIYVFRLPVYRGFSLYYFSASITLPVVLFCTSNERILIQFSQKTVNPFHVKSFHTFSIERTFLTLLPSHKDLILFSLSTVSGAWVCEDLRA